MNTCIEYCTDVHRIIETKCRFYCRICDFLRNRQSDIVKSFSIVSINEYFCVPNAQFIGITPQDIIDYKLPTHPLKDVDIKRVKDGIKNDPFIKHHKKWQSELNKLVKMKKRTEQQALAKHGLNFVISDYLPDKINNQKTWLP